MTSSRSNFFFICALITLAIVLLGFGPTFFLRSVFGRTDYATGSPQLPIHLTIHGITMTAWYVIFVVQTYLVRTRNISLHRNLGVAGIIVAILAVVSGFVVLIEFIPRNPFVEAVTAINIGNTVYFAVFLGMIMVGLLHRRKPDIHKRVMLVAGITNIGPALTSNRLLGESLHIVIPNAISLTLLYHLLIIGSLFFYDFRQSRRIHAASIVGGVVLISAYVISGVLATSSLGAAYYEFLSPGD